MNENINLVEILKDCPKGTKLYSPLFGEVEFLGIKKDTSFPIRIKCKSFKDSFREDFYRKDGSYCYPGECLLFPSKNQRDWGKFQPKKLKFDPKTLKPFDKVLTKHIGHIWRCDLFSHYREKNGRITSYCTNEGYIYHHCIPYNNETKHLVGTTKEAPEYYRYWED